MILFYTTNIKGNIATLPKEEAMHCTRTLRKKVGDSIALIDGKGGWYEGKIMELDRKSCTIAIEKTIEHFEKRDFKIHIAIAPTKNISRFEWFLEKATEIGIDEITPLYCHHSERKNIRLDRLNKVLIAAMKQSLKAYLPQLNELTKYNDFITKTHDFDGQKFIAHCEDGNERHLKNQYEPEKNVLILIGPEGDFSIPEIKVAKENNFQEISLGKARLRTETAGIVACHTIHLCG